MTHPCLKAAVLGLVLLSGAAQARQAGEPGIVRSGTGPAMPGPAATFTGRVTVQALAAPTAPGRTSVGAVSFAPGARSNWHTHPAGQALVMTEGCGWTQRQGGPILRICQGDTASVPPGVKHWHGATATSGMTHLAITETIDGRNVHWMEPVTDAQYSQGPAADG